MPGALDCNPSSRKRSFPRMFRTVPRLLLALPVSVVAVSVMACSNYSLAQSCAAQHHPSFRVEVAPGVASEHLSGRLIVMMATQARPAEKVTPSYGPDAHSVWVAAKEIRDLVPGTPVELHPDELAYPRKFCSVPEGSYKLKAVLDITHEFAYPN